MDTSAMEAKITALENELRSIKDHDSTVRRDIYGRLSALEKSSARIDEGYKHIMDELRDQKGQLQSILQKLDALSERPGRRWDAAVASIVSALIASVVGFLAAQVKGG